MRRLLFLATVAALVNAEAKPMRIVQIDLARQMTTLSTLSNWVDRVASYGYDTVQLYVEGRIATKTFALPKGESYPAEEMTK